MSLKWTYKIVGNFYLKNILLAAVLLYFMVLFILATLNSNAFESEMLKKGNIKKVWSFDYKSASVLN